MDHFQPWLVATLASAKTVAAIMRSRWGWPICETVHFLGLSMLIGAIGIFDLRLLGVARRIPIAALHRVIPWGISGYVINILSGSMFLMTEPEQYIYNPSFHFKILFMGLAGLNVLVFYSAVFRRVRTLGPGDDAPVAAKLIGGFSLFLWIGIIVFGRMLTFYRPFRCSGQPMVFPFYCLP